MIIVAGTIEMDPAKTEEFNALAVKTMVATEQEAGCVSYTFSHKAGSPGTVVIQELWETQEALDGHFATPHMAEFMGGLGDFGVTASTVTKYEADAGTKLM